eukprot:scaffold3096_cov403-Prasinococcus_capsulatus_cf.AAC.5
MGVPRSAAKSTPEWKEPQRGPNRELIHVPRGSGMVKSQRQGFPRTVMGLATCRCVLAGTALCFCAWGVSFAAAFTDHGAFAFRAMSGPPTAEFVSSRMGFCLVYRCRFVLLFKSSSVCSATAANTSIGSH